MSEATVINQTKKPLTIEGIANDLKQLGLKPGMAVIVHSSLSSFGYVVGGSVAIVIALMDVVTDQGTIIMPTHTSDYSDPAVWGNPPVPQRIGKK